MDQPLARLQRVADQSNNESQPTSTASSTTPYPLLATQAIAQTVWNLTIAPIIGVVRQSSSTHPRHNHQQLSAGASMRRKGVILQHCPECAMPYSVPVNCDHVTCERELGGCGTEFCYICAAPRSPILAHGNYMHRFDCAYNVDQYCCAKHCLRNNQMRCVEMEFRHDCIECQKLGSPCTFPQRNCDNRSPDIPRAPALTGGGFHWKILNPADVEDERRLLEDISSSTAGRRTER
jgi:hypothetical protein